MAIATGLYFQGSNYLRGKDGFPGQIRAYAGADLYQWSTSENASIRFRSDVGDNVRALTAIQGDTTNNPKAVHIENDGTGDGLFIDQDGNGIAINIDSEATTSDIINISGATLTSGKAIDISDLAAFTTGKAIHVDATGTTHTTGILVHIDSAGTAITGAGRLLRVDHTGATTTSGVIAEIASAATDETVIARITASAALAAGVALDVSASSMTTGTAIDVGNLNAITTGKGLNIATTSAFQSTAQLLSVSATSNAPGLVARTGAFTSITSSRTERRTSGSTSDDYDVLSLIRTNIVNDAGATFNAAGSVLRIENVATPTAGILNDTVKVLEVVQDADSTGVAVYIDHNNTSYAIEIDQDGNSASTIWAMKIDSDNAGSGVGGGIDFSSMAQDEPVLKAVADAITTAGTLSQQIAVDIGGTIYYLYAYTTGS